MIWACRMSTWRCREGFLELDDAGRMKPSAFYDRVVDVMEELAMFMLLTLDLAPYLVDRYSEREESAEEMSRRVDQRSICGATASRRLVWSARFYQSSHRCLPHKCSRAFLQPFHSAVAALHYAAEQWTLGEQA